MQLPGAVRGGLESLFRASQTFSPHHMKRSSLGRFNSLGRQFQQPPPLQVSACCKSLIGRRPGGSKMHHAD